MPRRSNLQSCSWISGESATEIVAESYNSTGENNTSSSLNVPETPAERRRASNKGKRAPKRKAPDNGSDEEFKMALKDVRHERRRAIMAGGREELSSGLKVCELREKLAEFGLSTQGNKETLRERLASFLDAEGNKDHDILSEDSPNETEMPNFIASSTQVTIPVNVSASGTDGSQDLEAFDIKAKLNSVCEDIEILKLSF